MEFEFLDKDFFRFSLDAVRRFQQHAEEAEPPASVKIPVSAAIAWRTRAAFF